MTNGLIQRRSYRGRPQWSAVVVCFVLAVGLASSSGPAESLARSTSAPRPAASSIAKHVAAPVTVAPAPAAELMHDAPVAVASLATVDEPEAPTEPAGHKVAKKRVLLMEVTAYCACKKCCGSHAQGLTASGKRISYNNGRFVAADTRMLPFGTQLVIPGYNNGKPVEVIDKGGAIKGKHIDLFMPSHQKAIEWGKQWLEVTVVE